MTEVIPAVPMNGWQMAVIVVPMILTFLGTVVTSVLAYMAQQKSQTNTTAIQRLDIKVDGRLTELLAEKDSASKAKEAAALAVGTIAGAAAEVARSAALSAPTSSGQSANTAALTANTAAMDASIAESQRHSP